MALALALVIGTASLAVVGGVVYVMTPSPQAILNGQQHQSAASITQSTLRAWVSGQYGSSSLFTSTANLHCVLSHGSTLPSGLTLGDNCTVSGVHTLAPGTTKEISPPFAVIVNWTNSNADYSYTFSIITEASSPLITAIAGECVEGVKCGTQVADATGGTPPYYFASDTFRNGAPPFGLVIGTDGYLTGVPKLGSNGTYDFGVCVTDSVAATNCTQTSVVIDTKEVNCTSGNTGINCGSSNNVTVTVPQAQGSWTTWTADVTGVITQNPEDMGCHQGRISVNAKLTFTAPPGFIAAAQNHTRYFASYNGAGGGAGGVNAKYIPTGTVSATYTPTAQCESIGQEGGFQLNGGAASFNTSVGLLLNFPPEGVDGDNGNSIYFSTEAYANGTSIENLPNYMEIGGSELDGWVEIGKINIISISPSQITGTMFISDSVWDTENFTVVFNRVS